MKNIFIYIFAFILIGCKGQTNQDIEKSFNSLSEYYFDKDDKIPLKYNLNKKEGGYIVYYIPKKNIKNYYANFLKINNIIAIEDEYNETYSYKIKDRKKISLLLKNKLIDANNYNIVGKYIPSEYFIYEDSNNYSLNYPYKIIFFKNNNNRWIVIKELNVKSYDDDIKYSKREFIESLIKDENIPEKKILLKKQHSSLSKDWNGEYNLTLNKDNDDWRNIHEIKLLISDDSVIYSAEGFQLYENYILDYVEKNNSISLGFAKALNNTENKYHLKNTTDFGKIIFDGKNYIWKSPYIDLNFNNGKKQSYKLNKIK